MPNQVVYSATKAAVLAISDGLRQELAGHIRVSTILPGFTDTAFSEHVKGPELKEELKRLERSLPCRLKQWLVRSHTSSNSQKRST